MNWLSKIDDIVKDIRVAAAEEQQQQQNQGTEDLIVDDPLLIGMHHSPQSSLDDDDYNSESNSSYYDSEDEEESPHSTGVRRDLSSSSVTSSQLDEMHDSEDNVTSTDGDEPQRSYSRTSSSLDVMDASMDATLLGMDTMMGYDPPSLAHDESTSRQTTTKSSASRGEPAESFGDGLARLVQQHLTNRLPELQPNESSTRRRRSFEKKESVLSTDQYVGFDYDENTTTNRELSGPEEEEIATSKSRLQLPAIEPASSLLSSNDRTPEPSSHFPVDDQLQDHGAATTIEAAISTGYESTEARSGRVLSVSGNAEELTTEQSSGDVTTESERDQQSGETIRHRRAHQPLPTARLQGDSKEQQIPQHARSTDEKGKHEQPILDERSGREQIVEDSDDDDSSSSGPPLLRRVAPPKKSATPAATSNTTMRTPSSLSIMTQRPMSGILGGGSGARGRPSLPQNIELFHNKDDDLRVTFPLKPWMEESDAATTRTAPIQNAMGVVHVRLVAAQRLPCPVASSIQAVVGLAPWKGRVRSQKVQSFAPSTGDSSSGVCTRWSIEHATQQQVQNQEWMDDLAVGMCSMVHQYNGEDTPVPTIQLELVFHPLHRMGFLEFSMCSLELSCEPLMRQPGVWRRNVWCQAKIAKSMLHDKVDAATKRYHEHHQPLICLDAAFFPATDDEDDGERELEQPDTDDLSVDAVLSAAPPSDRGLSFSEDAKTESIPLTTPPPVRARSQNRQSDSGTRSSNRGIVFPNSTSSVASGGTTGTGGTGGTTLTSLHAKRKPHLLRVMSLWVPAECAVCKKNITGWHRAYRCETCQMDCCSDCRLQVDLQIPCGSNQSKEAIEASLQRKMTLGNIVKTMAPPDAVYEQRLAERRQRGKELSNPQQQQQHPSPTARSALSLTTSEDSEDDVVENESAPSVGHLATHIRRACLFSRPMVPEAEPSDVFDESLSRGLNVSDYYVRISPKGSKVTKRTRIVQNSGKPSFVGEKDIILNAPNYNMEFLVEVVDATTDKPVGCSLLTVHSLLQLQRDEMIAEHGVMAHVPFVGKPLVCTTKRRRKLELRTGVKTGFGPDFFVPASNGKRTDNGKKSKPGGEIVGWVEMDVLLQEDYSKLYGPNPVECEEGGPDDLNIDMFQIHVARISALVGDVNRAIQSYIYLISWKNPWLTGTSFVIFLYTTLRFNTEYFGSIPIFWLICCMVYLAWTRKDAKNRFREREKLARLQNYNKKYDSSKGDTSGSLHRPVGQLEVSIRRGKNLTTRDLGLPGGVCCRVYWDPLRYARDERAKKRLGKFDSTLQARHDVGETNSVYSVNPEWTGLVPSAETKRLQQVLPNQDDDLHGGTMRPEKDIGKWSSIMFPLLRPIRPAIGSAPTTVAPSLELDSWSNSVGAVVFQVRFQDVLNSLPGFENVLGEVAIPLSKLMEQREICGWYQVLDTGSAHAMPVSGGEFDDGGDSNESDSPLIWIDARWRPPLSSNDTPLNATDREAAIVVAQELHRSAAMTLTASTKKLDLIGSSIGAFNTVRGIGGSVQNIQNMLGGVLDIVERLRNAFNFTDPFKSSFVLMSLVLVWLFFAFVSTRIICLTVGLAQYLGMLAVRISELLPRKPKPKAQESELDSASSTADKGDKGSPVAIWLRNAIMGLPTEEDLRRTYFWESRRVGERAYFAVATAARESRLEHLWKAQWYDSLSLRTTTTGKGKDKRRNSEVGGPKKWQENVFAVFHGRRLLWWNSTADFDDGELPSGTLVLAGHAGLAGLSPLEMRELAEGGGEDEAAPIISRIVAIFGRGKEGQQKVTLWLPTVESKERLESIVLAASIKQD